MLIINIKFYFFLLFLQIFSSFSTEIKSKLTFNEFFNYTTFSLLSFSPNGQYLLFQTKYPSWNTNSFKNNLWLYNIKEKTKKLIIKNSHKSIKPQWSPSGNWIALLLDEKLSNNYNQTLFKNLPQIEHYIYLYSLVSNDLLPIQIGKDIPLAFTWSNNDSSLYLATVNLQAIINKTDDDDDEWKDVIQYRQSRKNEQSIIYQINFEQNYRSLSIKKNIIKNLPFFISELLFVPLNEKFLCTSVSTLMEDLEDFEIYSIDLRNTSSSLIRLTDNEAFEEGLKLSIDNKYVLFQTSGLGSNKNKSLSPQVRLYSIDLTTGQLIRLAENFQGSIFGYTIRSDGSIYILGQLGTEVQIYSQRLLTEDLIKHIGWNGTYHSIISSNQNDFISFIYSSTENPMEIYLINNINQLQLAEIITDENKIFTQRNLPQTKVYKWINEEDHQIIEGILHYPPGKFQSNNLPLLVLIHGGPFSVNHNQLNFDWYNWATLAASEGWLVLEPNYRGSTGYGDQFLNEIRYKPVSLPGKDILFGVDQLIKDGIVDPYRLTIGGYSYGGFLTNWLITQTKRFNAALSGAGNIEHSSAWGTKDIPVFIKYLFGGFPWETSYVYQNEAPIYQLDRVRTPTLIVTGGNDVRVPTSQSYMMERGLHYRGVPVKLIILPNEGHELSINPWHGKIKVREELKWLKKYGNQSSIP